MTARRDPRALLALLVVQVCFATYPTFGKIAMLEIPPMLLASLRAAFGGAALILLTRLLVPEDPVPTRLERRLLIVLSLLGVVANQVLFISGLVRTTATNATLLVTSVPVFTLLFGAFRQRQLPPRNRLLGIPIALAGVLWLLDVRRFDLADTAMVGNLMILANCFCYSLFLVLSRPALRRRSAISFTAWIFVLGIPPILLAAIPDMLTFRPAQVSARAWLAAAAVVVLATIVAYSLNAWGLSRTDAATTAVFIYVQPVISTALAWAVLGERPSGRVLIAAAFIFAGVALATWPARRDSVAGGP